MTKYYTVSLPEKLIKKIDEKIIQSDYTSRADFVKTAVREKLRIGG